MSRKMAIVHDFLYWHGGAERCLLLLKNIFPGARIFSLFYSRERLPLFSECAISTTFLDRIPLVRRHHYYFLPLYPLAVESIDLKEYEVVLSNSWAWSKNVKVPPEACHICYCYTPMRFAYELEGDYLRRKKPITRFFLTRLIKKIRAWDQKRTGTVDYFIAISAHVRQRIEKCYGSP